MKTISKAEWDRIGEDYKGTFSDFQGTAPYHKGRRCAFLPGEGTTLFLEGVHFLVKDDYSHLPILHKNNAVVGCAYQTAGGVEFVRRIYRLTETQAEDYGCMYLDRVETTRADFALPGSDVYRRKHGAQALSTVVPF